MDKQNGGKNRSVLKQIILISSFCSSRSTTIHPSTRAQVVRGTGLSQDRFALFFNNCVSQWLPPFLSGEDRGMRADLKKKTKSLTRTCLSVCSLARGMISQLAGRCQTVCWLVALQQQNREVFWKETKVSSMQSLVAHLPDPWLQEHLAWLGQPFLITDLQGRQRLHPCQVTGQTVSRADKKASSRSWVRVPFG